MIIGCLAVKFQEGTALNSFLTVGACLDDGDIFSRLTTVGVSYRN